MKDRTSCTVDSNTLGVIELHLENMGHFDGKDGDIGASIYESVSYGT